MNDNDWKKRLGVVYSTNKNFEYTQEEQKEEETLLPKSQRLIVSLDKRNRGGKTLKIKCGVGGTAKNGEITIQGDLRDKITNLLITMGYNAKRGN